MEPTSPPTPKVLETKKDWKESRKKRLLLISASQLETFNLCRRKWWLDKVRKLEVKSTSSQVFGTVLHSVCERYLLADDNGRDSKGNPVELYPQGWHIAEARFGLPSEGQVSPAEQDAIKTLIEKAIENGVLERLPGRKIEGEFRRTVLQMGCPNCTDGHRYDQDDNCLGVCFTCEGDKKGTHVQILGLIDVAFREEVQDHKTAKNMKYVKSPAALAKNIQMLTYAKELLLRAQEKGEPIPATVTLRHNVFCKEEGALRVRKTEVTVTREQIDAAYREVVENAKVMVSLRDTVDVWHEIADPANPSQACNAYGGCPFRSICAGHETEENYEKRVDFISKMCDTVNTGVSGVSTGTVNQTQGKGENMSFQAKLAAKQKVNAAAAAAPTSAPAPAPAMNPPVAQASVAPTPAWPAPAQAAILAASSAPAPVTLLAESVEGVVAPPPWAQSDCPACRGIGFNSKGAPCRICNNKAQVKGMSTSDAFIIEPLGNGKVVWMDRKNDQNTGESYLTGKPQEPVKADEKIKLAPEVQKLVDKAPLPAAPLPPPAVIEATPAPATPPAPAPVVAPVQAPAPQPAPVPMRVYDQGPAPVAADDVSGTYPNPVVDEGTGRSPGRPKKGFILVLNAVVAKGAERFGSGRGVHRLEDVLAQYGAELAKAKGVGSYYEINAFERRDFLAGAAKKISEDFGCDLVVCSGIGSGQSDLKSLFDALRPYAGMEIVAEQH